MCCPDEECKTVAGVGTGCYLKDAELEVFPISPNNTIQIVGAGDGPGVVVIDGGTLACFEDPFSSDCMTGARSANIGPIFNYAGADDVRGKTDCQTAGARKAYCAQQPFLNQSSYGTRNLLANLTFLRTPPETQAPVRVIRRCNCRAVLTWWCKTPSIMATLQAHRVSPQSQPIQNLSLTE